MLNNRRRNAQRKTLGCLILPIMLMGMLNSCTKTEDVLYEKEAVNRIISYEVVNAVEPLHGVVDDINNRITVYIPYYISIDYLVPVITLEEGAKLIDRNGNELDIREDLEPVPFDTVGYTYRVKDAEELIREYTLAIKVMPHNEPLVIGFGQKQNESGIWVVDDDLTKAGVINSRIRLLGNFQSTSRNAKLSLIHAETGQAVPNALAVYDMLSGSGFYTLLFDVSPEVDPGNYVVKVEHQGRTATTAQISFEHRMPYFGQLPKIVKQGEEITMTVGGPNSNGEVYSNTNPGIKKAYIIIKKEHITERPADFPEALFDTPIDLEIIEQNRTSVTFRFPEHIPAGLYYAMASTSSGIYDGYSINYTGFGIYFDFDYKDWGTGNLRVMIPYLGFEVKKK